MNIFQLFQTCFRSIFRNRMRSLLTSLGIIIGVASVVVIVALGEGTQQSIEAEISAMGTNLLTVSPSRSFNRTGQTLSTRTSGFTLNDLTLLKSDSSFASAISGVVNISATVVGNMGVVQTSIMGVEPGFPGIRNYAVDNGIFFDETDQESRNQVAVLGRTTAANLFGMAELALNERFRIGNSYYTVIGLLESKGAGMGGNDQDDIIMIPMETAMARLSNTSTINSIVISVVDGIYMDAAARETRLILMDSRGIIEEANIDFNVSNSAEMIDLVTSITGILSVLLAAIAGISLLVGGIGIMNIMLVSVTERTREIGIRMAIGGRKVDILSQFLCEAIFLSLIGGLIGIGLASISCYALSNLGIQAIINPIIVIGATLFTALVGIIFGYYPASKAAKLYPIDALRYE